MFPPPPPFFFYSPLVAIASPQPLLKMQPSGCRITMKQLFLLKPSPASATGFFVTTRKFLMNHGGNFKTFCVNVLFFLSVLLPFYNHCQTACSSHNFLHSCHALRNFWEKEQFCEQTLHKRSNLVYTLYCLHTLLF